MTQQHEMNTDRLNAVDIGTRLHEALELLEGISFYDYILGDTARLDGPGFPSFSRPQVSIIPPMTVDTDLIDLAFAAYDRDALAPRTWLA